MQMRSTLRTTNIAATRVDIVRLSSEIVSAYLCHNTVSMPKLLDLIEEVHATLLALSRVARDAVERPVQLSQAEIRRSITPGALISFVDGRPYQVLKRHLTRYGLTPKDYRTRFGLPEDYPMVASVYAAKQSALAKAAGLGSLPDRRGVKAVRSGAAARQVTIDPTAEAGTDRRSRTKATSVDNA